MNNISTTETVVSTLCGIENITEVSNTTNISAVFADIILPSTKLYKAPLWKTNFPEAVVYCSLTLFIIVVGTFGNTAMIVLNIIDSNMNNIGRIFIINIAIGDLCVAAIAEPVCIVGVYYGEEWFDQYWFMCELVAILCFIACIGSYLSFVLRAVNRYVYLCRQNIYYDIYSNKRALFACVICWIIAAIIDSANLLGWGDHNFDLKSHRCVWDRNASFSYTMVIGVVLLVPFPPTVACFVLIFKEIFKRKKMLFSFNTEDQHRQRKAFIESFRASRTLLLGFISFLVLWAPAGSLVLIDFADTVKMEIYLFCVMLAHFHSCSDFIIDFVVDKKFRQKIINLFIRRKLPAKKKAVGTKA